MLFCGIIVYDNTRTGGNMRRIQLINDDYSGQVDHFRHACRGILINNGEILLGHESNNDKYIIPGGGVEDNESPVVIECELIEFVESGNFTTVLAKVVNMAADESVLGEDDKIDTGKIGMIFYESFSNSYYKLGEKVGKAWSEGKVFME